ncbi:MAG TPA: crosslink repair DNA glycosylase YcaQ family protein [Candidatus Limnocylindrales bacterium]|nr:crosslink repair DNA glycosylase YcaQ family protein [Candidatus Limnocylindrales bacterium]
MGQRPALEVDRARIIGYRQRAQALDARLPPGPDALRRAAWAGLQDSMPRAALLSLHARVAGIAPQAWEDPALVQLWGPRYSAYVVAAQDRAAFTLGRLPDVPAKRQMAEAVAADLAAFLGGREMDYSAAGHAMGVPPNSLRYAAPTGTVLIRWDGARRPTIRVVPPPELGIEEARLELARRYLHVFGPSTAAAFGAWAGISPAQARRTFEALGAALIAVRTPLGEARILASDEAALRDPRAAPRPKGDPPAADVPTGELPAGDGPGGYVPPGELPAGELPAGPVARLLPGPVARLLPGTVARLLPSGDPYFLLLQGPERALLVADATQRAALWTPRVWPGALLLDGEIVGTWRRAEAEVVVSPWRRLRHAERDAVVAEVEALPLPGLQGRLTVGWVD